MGNVSILKKYFKVFTPNFYLVNNEKVSSTKIKEYIRNGEVEKANYMLDRHYFYKGTVIKGLQNGSKFLFPTINLSLLTNYVLLKNGVYQTQITIDGVIYDSITNIGVHPTIDKLSSPSIETFVLNFNKEVYEKNIKLEFIKFIREEKKFSSLEQLKQQILQDISNCGLKF